MHVVISPGDINSYKANEQGKCLTQVLQVFFTINTPFSERHATAYKPYIFCCSTDFQGHLRQMNFTLSESQYANSY